MAIGHDHLRHDHLKEEVRGEISGDQSREVLQITNSMGEVLPGTFPATAFKRRF
jgi:hypothetical protein